MIHIHLEKVQDIGGFALSNALEGETIEVLHRASITSEEPEFYRYVDQLSNQFLGMAGVSPSAVCQFLALIHQDLSADLYVNDFSVAVVMRAKKAIKKGEVVRKGDIAGIRKLTFSDIEIATTDKVAYCFKVGWKFGLFFDLNRQELLDMDKMSLDSGALYRYLLFQDVYEVLASQKLFEDMIKDGWFPFIGIIGGEYETLSRIYKDRFNFENRIKKFVDGFDRTRVESIINGWWNKSIFRDKQRIITAGVEAYLSDDDPGFINCAKNLSTEIEGIIRLQYLQDTGKGRRVTIPDLLNYVLGKGKGKCESEYELFLPRHFFEYLKDVVFANFDLQSGKVDLSRHTSSHGVAKALDYTKIKALQMILILDQIYFFI